MKKITIIIIAILLCAFGAQAQQISKDSTFTEVKKLGRDTALFYYKSVMDTAMEALTPGKTTSLNRVTSLRATTVILRDEWARKLSPSQLADAYIYGKELIVNKQSTILLEPERGNLFLVGKAQDSYRLAVIDKTKGEITTVPKDKDPYWATNWVFLAAIFFTTGFLLKIFEPKDGKFSLKVFIFLTSGSVCLLLDTPTLSILYSGMRSTIWISSIIVVIAYLAVAIEFENFMIWADLLAVALFLGAIGYWVTPVITVVVGLGALYYYLLFTSTKSNPIVS